MDGSPLIRLAAVLVFLALVGLPVFALTREKSGPMEHRNSSIEKQPGEQPVDLKVTLSRPGKVEIKYLDEVIAGSSGDVMTFEKQVKMPVAKVELTAKFQWPDDRSSHAGRVVVSRDGDTLADGTFWGETEAEDVLSFRVPSP
jgi:hypothetical protein